MLRIPPGCMSIELDPDGRVVRRARAAMLTRAIYGIPGFEEIPAHVLSQAARDLYIEGAVPLETLEAFLDLQFGLPIA